MKPSFLYLLILLSFCSCVKNSLTNSPIKEKRIYGKYVLKDKQNETILILNSNHTFQYIKKENNIIVLNEIGAFEYYRTTQYNILDMFVDTDKVPDPSVHYLYERYLFYVCSFWGKIRIGWSISVDPDGAPATPWLKKVE